MCEWTRERELLKNFLRILSEWFPKHLEISLRITSVQGFESLSTAKPAAVGSTLSMAAHLRQIFYIYDGSKEASEKNKVRLYFSRMASLNLACHGPALLIDEMSDA